MKLNVEIPDEINYVEMYFTLKCNLGCSYCINNNSGVIRNRTEISAKEMAENINRLNFKKIPLTIGGGEPTLRKDFFDFVNNLKPEIKIDLLTNLTFDIDNFMKNISINKFYLNEINDKSYKSIRVSYHPEYMNIENLINKSIKLQENGYSIGIFGINHPANMQSNIKMAEYCRQSKIYFFIKDFLGFYDNQLFGYFHNIDGLMGGEKKCKCRTKELLIDSSGSIYKCHRDLYHNEYVISNILDENLKIEYKMRDCLKFGQCNPCDLKIKLNRFLQMGQQSTEIII